MTKKAVLIGCNYEGTKAELKGCINDVRRMHKCLVDRYGFSEDNITVLIDTDDSYIQPTGKNIRRVLGKLVRSAKPGDYLFVHYSGHGTRLPAESGEMDDTGYDECIVPTDMNLITDDDFKDLVCRVPDGCRLTIVSDSCHSGGLIDDAIEQIGESTSANQDQQDHSPVHSITGLLKQTVKDKVREKLATRGLHVPSSLRHQTEIVNYAVVEEGHEDRESVTSRSLPLSTLVEILQQKTGKDDIDVGKLRPALYQIFGEDASPKVKKFMNFIFQKLQHRSPAEDEGMESEGEEAGGFFKMIGNLAQEFLKQSLEDNDEAYVKPALQTQVENKHEIYAGTNKDLPQNGILLSGCQSDQTSADAAPQGNASAAYGAFSNTIQAILAGSDDSITNQDLVLKARKMLKRQGFTQRPGLYCSNNNTDAPFIC